MGSSYSKFTSSSANGHSYHQSMTFSTPSGQEAPHSSKIPLFGTALSQFNDGHITGHQSSSVTKVQLQPQSTTESSSTGVRQTKKKEKTINAVNLVSEMEKNSGAQSSCVENLACGPAGINEIKNKVLFSLQIQLLHLPAAAPTKSPAKKKKFSFGLKKKFGLNNKFGLKHSSNCPAATICVKSKWIFSYFLGSFKGA